MNRRLNEDFEWVNAVRKAQEKIRKEQFKKIRKIKQMGFIDGKVSR